MPVIPVAVGVGEVAVEGGEIAVEGYELYRAYRAAQAAQRLAKAASAAAAAAAASQNCPTCCKRDVVISKSASPEAAKHIQDAQAQGKPSVLTLDRPGTDARRAANLKGVATATGKDRDEYPPATFAESVNASVKLIDSSDNRRAGQALKTQMNSPTKATEGCKVTITVGP